jgi:hypothetical protein
MENEELAAPHVSPFAIQHSTFPLSLLNASEKTCALPLYAAENPAIMWSGLIL